MLSIGKLAKETGVKVPTIRYYEQIGLLLEPSRSSGNQRIYGDKARQQLAFIHHSREMGFSLEAIADLLNLADHPEQSCAAADSIARAQLEAVERRIKQLQKLRLELKQMVDDCHGDCVSDCRVIEVLSDHNQCHGSHEVDSRV